MATQTIYHDKTSLTGGSATALDGIDGNSLVDGDRAYVLIPGTLTFYVYRLNATSGAAESSPNIIVPDTNPGNKRWILFSVMASITGLQQIVPNGNFTLRQNSVNVLTSEETGGIANTLYLKAGKVGIGTTGPNSILTLGGASPDITVDTADASDTKGLRLSGGGGIGNARGGLFQAFGNEHATLGGRVYVEAGNVATGNIYLQTGATNRVAILNNGNVGIGTESPGAKLEVTGPNGTVSTGLHVNRPAGAATGASTTMRGLLVDQQSNNDSVSTIGVDSTVAHNLNYGGTVAVKGTANSIVHNTNGAGIGVYGIANQTNMNGSGIAIGVKGEATGISTGGNGTTYAGYFDNPTTVAGSNYGVYITTGSGGDYGLYQTGTGANYFAGNVGIGTTDLDGTPAVGKLTIKGSTNDGSTYIDVWRDSDEANVASLDTNGNFYTVADVSALTFTDRTPFYDGDALAALASVVGKDGGIDHTSLPVFAQKKIRRTVYLDGLEVLPEDAFETVDIEEDEMEEITDEKGEAKKQPIVLSMKQVQKGFKLENNMPVPNIVEESVHKKVSKQVTRIKENVRFNDKTGTFHQREYQIVEEDGRDLGAMISILVKAIQQLQKGKAK